MRVATADFVLVPLVVRFVSLRLVLGGLLNLFDHLFHFFVVNPFYGAALRFFQFFKLFLLQLVALQFLAFYCLYLFVRCILLRCWRDGRLLLVFRMLVKTLGFIVGVLNNGLGRLDGFWHWLAGNWRFRLLGLLRWGFLLCFVFMVFDHCLGC